MSFSHSCKLEVLKTPLENDCCSLAFLCGLLHACGEISISDKHYVATINTDIVEVYDFCNKILQMLYGDYCTLEITDDYAINKRVYYEISFPKDKSEEIIKKYQENYSNIKALKKENGGLSDARNFGVKSATGDYICFIDSDDYIDENLFSNLEKYLDLDYDMIKYKLIKVDENYNQIEKIDGPIFENKTGEESFNILYGQDIMLQPAWLYLYKKSFWDENKFEYPVGKVHEDFATTALIMLKAKKVISTNIYGYYYYQSNSSITRGNDESKKMKRALDMLEHYDNMIPKIKTYDISKITEENIKIYYNVKS